MNLAESTLFDIRLCSASMQQAVDAITNQAKAGNGGLVCVANVDMMTRAKKNKRLAHLMSTARFTVTDGMPLVWALRYLKGLPKTERINGPALTLELCRRAETEGLSVFLYGGTSSEIDLMRSNLLQQFPNLKIAGAISPPLLPTEPPFDAAIVNQINSTEASLIFVGLGCPKQEFWMDIHQHHLRPLAIGVGFAFAMIAGTKSEAPHWMQKSGLEWFYRLLQEPRRLWRRYLVGNSLFIAYIFKELLTQKH